MTRDTLVRKYATASGVVSKLDIALITVIIGAGTTWVIILAARTTAKGLDVLAGVACTFFRGKLNTKRRKNSDIAAIAS